jgi:hypothetical protein
VKLTLVIVCSLVLGWVQIAPARTPASNVQRGADACCHCGRASCCATPNLPRSQQPAATPVSSASQRQILSLAAALVAWAPPSAPAPELSSSAFSPFPAAGTPLYARNCARLL